MKIGMMNNPRVDLDSEIAWARDMRFDYLDLTLEPSKAHPKAIDVKKTARALRKAGLEIVGHTAYYLPLASPMESVREAACGEMASALKVFSQLGASKMTIHPDRSIPFVLGQKGVTEKNLESLRKIQEIADPLGIQILLENMDRTFNTVEQIAEALTRFPGLGFHLDVGHANLNTDRNRTEEFLKAFHRRLHHVHLSDNFGKGDDLHLPLGAGSIDWKRMIALLKRHGYDGTITLEVFSADRRYLLFSREKLKELWEAAEEAS
ncbi:MAG TPA: sugar phosphate isomerase/epimerase family protein [Thermodesulfobacteriota bacterium]|nr:sugar phosphate isomerase/epimerase family protein [Thermodesulfobacteriota bacterium]